MNSRSAWFWAFTAATLFLALVGYERFFHRPPRGPAPLFPGLRAADVRAVQVLPADAPEVRVVRTNGTWALTRPFFYPAQSKTVEALLAALETTVPVTTIEGADLKSGSGQADPYGLSTPRGSLVLDLVEGRQQLLIGSLTAPGDQIFVQVVGHGGVSVLDAELIALVPATPDMWRDSSVFGLEDEVYDTITVTRESGVLELRRTRGDAGWEIVRPMTARADGALIATLIRGLRDLSVRRFVSDDPRADRTVWGLQPPELQIVFAKGSNTVRTLDFGQAVDGGDETIYAIGRTPAAVVTVPSASLSVWGAAPNDFRDRRLVRVPTGVTSIEVGNEESFSLIRSTNSNWRVEPAGFAADPDTVARFIKDLEALRVSRFVKDVVANPDLPAYGLADPSFRVVLSAASTSASEAKNVVGLEFGSADEESVFVRRVDENAVYAVRAAALEKLPAAAGHFRAREVWTFDVGDVKALAVQKGTKSWRVLRNGMNQWVLAPGSQGLINAFAVEETVHQLGELRAIAWTDWSQTDTARYGLNADSVTLTVELKDETRRTVRFGFPSPATHVYAGVLLDGSSWVFEFPSDTFDLVERWLIKPSNLR